MAGEFLGTYDPAEVTLILSGLTISGFMDGTFITLAQVDNETYKMHVGAHGEVARTKSNDKTGTITFTLKKTSPANKICDLLKLSPLTFPSMCKNNSDAKHIAVATESWIGTDPDIEHADEESGVEWVVACADLIKSHI